MRVFALLILTAMLLSGCRSVKYVPVITESGDSICTETRRSVVMLKDTVWTEIPAQRAERETRDTVSFLENDYSESRAWIAGDGTLRHTLATKPRKVAHEFYKPVERTASTVYKYRYRTRTEVETVERELTWLERLRLDSWWLPALAAALLLILTLRRKGS